VDGGAHQVEGALLSRDAALPDADGPVVPVVAVHRDVEEERRVRAAEAMLRQRTVDRLWTITEELNILYRSD
jgi:hypothetical protein